MKIKQSSRVLYQPGVQSNALLDSALVSRCRLDMRCICARKAIVLKFSLKFSVGFHDVFSRNDYQSDELFQNELQCVTRSSRVPYRNHFDRRRYYSMKENVLSLKHKTTIIELNLHGSSPSHSSTFSQLVIIFKKRDKNPHIYEYVYRYTTGVYRHMYIDISKLKNLIESRNERISRISLHYLKQMCIKRSTRSKLFRFQNQAFLIRVHEIVGQQKVDKK